MGNLIWHQLARFISITANVYAVWASFWAFIFRKFFWDFIGGIVRTPGGIQPASNVGFFITIIVKFPVIPIFSMILGLSILALECPLPQMKAFSVHRSLVLRLVLLLFQALLCILYYQGTNACLYALTAAFCYGRAISLGETMEEAKDNRGRAGKA